MKPWARFVIVLIAYSLALLHTAVPHEHTADLAGRTTFSAARCTVSHDVAGFLQSVFSTDLGYGHLETFQKGSGADIDVTLAEGPAILAVLIPLLILLTPATPAAGSASGFIDKLYKRLILFCTSHLRAPPVPR